jgi:hypothetical protein
MERTNGRDAKILKMADQGKNMTKAVQENGNERRRTRA